MAIKSFRHKGLKKFFYEGTEKGINPNHAEKLGDILDAIEASHHPSDLKALFGSPTFGYKKGAAKGIYSLQVNGNWRVTFEIEDDGAVLLDYCDYHGKKLTAKK